MNQMSDMNLKEFSELHSVIYRALLNSLNTNYSWKKLLTTLRSYMPLIINDRIRNIERATDPALILLQELQIRCAKVNHLRRILRESDLLNSLALISDPEQIQIIEQPGENYEYIQSEQGSNVVLKCVAKGLPPPLYQWYRGNLLLNDQTEPTLSIANFGEEDCDEYYCIAYHVVNDRTLEFSSNTVILELLPIPPAIVVDLPPVVTVNAGDDVKLYVEAIYRPQATFTWVFGNTVLDDETSDSLLLKDVQESDQGQYHCLIRNKAGDVISKTCDVIVIDIPSGTPYENIASGKVALLIANSVYNNFGDLLTPSNDVSVVAHEFVKLDFRVIVLQNLTLVEMKNAVKWFCQILPVDAYALFYFVGHGFKLNNKYMIPVDCPDSEHFAVSDCYSYEMLIESVMRTEAQLLVTILDMCLKVPLRENLCGREPITKYKRKKGFTLIENFSTSSHMEAYERQTEDLGLYAKHLIKFICEDSPITSVLQSAIEEFAKCEEQCNQRPSLSHDDPWQKKFTDSGKGDERLDREMSLLYEIPEEVELDFPRVGVNPCVKLCFYKQCFVNTIVFIFPVELNVWDISAEVNQEDLSNYQWTEDESCQKILTLFDLQKAKTSISIYIQLNKKRMNGYGPQFLDWCELDLSCIGIVQKCLWFNDKNSL